MYFLAHRPIEVYLFRCRICSMFGSKTPLISVFTCEYLLMHYLEYQFAYHLALGGIARCAYTLRAGIV